MRQRVRRAGIELGAPIREARRHARVLALHGVRVLHEAQVECLPKLIGHATRRHVDDGGIEVSIGAVRPVHAQRGAAAELTAHAAGVLEDIRRFE